MSYKFKTVAEKDWPPTGKLLNPLQWDEAEFRARLLGFFGEPQYSTDDYENAFDYNIVAESETGEVVHLTAYQGPSGPAIGAVPPFFGGNDEKNREAANQLLEQLKQTPPADFDACTYYADVDYTVWYGCKDGKYYSRGEKGDHTRSG